VSPLGTCGTNKEVKWETVTKRRANTLRERNIQRDDSPDFFTGAELEEFSAPAVDEHNIDRFTGRNWEQTAIAPLVAIAKLYLFNHHCMTRNYFHLSM